MGVKSFYAGADLPGPSVVAWGHYASAIVGIGPRLGLPVAIWLWPQARPEAAQASQWVDCPHDGRGQAAWENGINATEAPNGEVALMAAHDIKVLTDVACLLHGVAVVLPAPGCG